MAFVFYDTETTGLNTNYDQILQFAAIKTDHDLNEIDRFECRSRLLPYVVPSPTALKINRTPVSQLIDSTLPSHYEMVCAIQDKLMAWSPNIFIGHNSLGFDEHLLRQAFYKTLHPPYLTNTNGNCRSDSIRMIQAVSIFEPNILKLPIDTEGKFTFKLDQLAPANGFNHKEAHEAMADVKATVHICRLIFEQAPEIWSNAMKFGQKAAVNAFIEEELLFSFSEYKHRKATTRVVTTLGLNPEMKTEAFVFNLSNDPENMIALTGEELEAKINNQEDLILILKNNVSPIIFSFDDVPDHMITDGLDRNELEARAKKIQDNPDFKSRLMSTIMSNYKIRENSEHVEEQIYDRFPSAEDSHKREVFHDIEWSVREKHLSRVTDERLKKLGLRLIYSERPDVIPKTKRLKLDKAQARRIMGSDKPVPWLTLPQAIDEANELLTKAEESELKLLSDLRDYLTQKSKEATLLL